jgi:hypothetical protein
MGRLSVVALPGNLTHVKDGAKVGVMPLGEAMG